ncbi:MAG: hypothetical protein NTZ33_01130 [Bacteroidetes bacterium]|nr:hypothetical protein [Bacteroidota bacterium]
MSENFEENKDENKLFEKLEYLERRVAQLEKFLGVRKVSLEEFRAYDKEMEAEEQKYKPSDVDAEIAMESRIGEFGLGWIGSIVLLFGISFITQYIQSTGNPLFSSIFGYFAAAVVFLIAYYIRKSVQGLSSKLNIISYILLFYVTLRLHFFTNFPLLSSAVVPILLMLLISGFQFYMANKNRSEFLAAIGLILLIVTANVSNTTHFMLAMVTLSVIYAVYLLYKNSWWKLIIVAQVLSYISFAVWYIIQVNSNSNFPANTIDQYTVAYLFICVSAFSMITLFKRRDTIPEAFVFISIFVNGLLFTLILVMYILSFYKTNYVGILLSIFVICIIFSVFLKKKSEWKYTPAFYALYGFVSVSTAIYGIVGFPLVYFLLSIQSLLVVSMAIWFRSKIIVLMNFGLFVFLILAYFFTFNTIHYANFSFGLVAIVTARIINLQSHRLDIKTDLLRNTYLSIGFIIMLFALYQAVPMQFVTLSWTLMALVYFIFSIILKNIKYRWMAIFTMIAAAIYLFIIDLANVGIIYRISAFMFLAVISIAISVYYSKNKKKPEEEKQDQE